MDFLGLKEKCHEMAEFYTRRMMIDSFQKGFETVYPVPLEEGADLIDISGSGKDIIESGKAGDDTVSFARDEKGYFAVIRDRKYYPIEMSGDVFIKMTERYEKLERSSFRQRLRHAPEILLVYYFSYPIIRAFSGVQDSVFLDLVSNVRRLEQLKRSASSTQI